MPPEEIDSLDGKSLKGLVLSLLGRIDELFEQNNKLVDQNNSLLARIDELVARIAAAANHRRTLRTRRCPLRAGRRRTFPTRRPRRSAANGGPALPASYVRTPP